MSSTLPTGEATVSGQGRGKSKKDTDQKLKQGVRVSLDMTTLTIMRILPREVDPMVSQSGCGPPVQYDPLCFSRGGRSGREM